MNTNIIPITRARSNLGNLATKVKGDKYIVLTKGGNPRAALVDINYLKNLEQEVQKIYGITFIDTSLLPLTRNFTNQEIASWEQEDKL